MGSCLRGEEAAEKGLFLGVFLELPGFGIGIGIERE